MEIKEIYQTPEMEAVLFESEDIITTSVPEVRDENELTATPW